MQSEQFKVFLKSFKIGFKGRLAVCSSLILSVSLYSFNYPLVRLAAAIATLVAAELFVYCYVPFYLNNLQLLFRTKTAEEPLPDELATLAKNMGLKVSKMKIFPKVCNAYARGNQLFIGQKLLEKLNAEQIKAVVAHEFGHIKGRHTLVQIFYIMPIMIFVALNWSKLPSAMLNIGLIAYMMVALVPLHWMIEKRADRAAVTYVGKDALKSALLTLVEKEKLNEPSETHPPINQRLRWIEQIKIKSINQKCS
jgi:Zn-dependent protease with chaperone function